MRKLFLLLCLGLLIQAAHAQEMEAQHTTAAAESKFMGMVELGFLYQDVETGFSTDHMTTLTFSIFSGYRFHRALNVGVTLGADFYNQVLVTPVALGIRGTLLTTRVSPFYSLDAGYGTTFFSSGSGSSKDEGGWMLNPALGLTVKTGNQTAYAFGLGYKFQRATSETQMWNTQTLQEEFTFKRLSVRMGFVF